MREGDLVADRFRVEGPAGSGGMGDVYRARDEERGERVALKVVSSMAHADRFEREATVLAGLHHPGIVRYVAHGRSEGALYLAMEWLDGEDLEARLARGPLGVDEALALVARVAAALGAAHAAGVVHRDVKPGNVFLVGGATDDVRLVDFGIARVAASDDERSLTEHGALLGSPAYMSPEQARGDADLDARADVYALGCVLFECLTGRPPFEGVHPMAVLCKILLDEPPRASAHAPDVPEDVEDLLARLLAKDRDRRPRDGAALAAEIARDVAPPSRGAPASAALGRLEQRLVFVVLVAGLLAPLGSRDGGAIDERNRSRLDVVRALAAPSDARVEPLRDGSVVVVLSHRGVALDRASEAARLALELAHAHHDVAVALVTGRVVAGSLGTVGEAIDRASMLALLGASTGEVRVDDVTAGLLATRFEVRATADGLAITAARAIARAERTLLGRPTPFVGRDAELRALVDLIEEVVATSSPRVARVTAPSGGGKSRLRYEVLRRALEAQPAAQPWASWGEQASVGTPLGAFAPMLRRIAGVAPDDPPEARVQKLRACAARSVAAPEAARVAEFLGEIAGVPFPDGESAPLRAARADRSLLADQVGRAWSDFVVAELSVHPVLMVIEDAHWVDRRTFELVESALAAACARKLPLAVLVFGRHAVTPGAPAMAAMTSGAPVLEIALAELDVVASAALVRAVLGDIAPERVLAMQERAAGNPFHLEELIRADAEGRGARVADTATAVAEARLDALDPEARRLARAAGILGGSFDLAELVPLVDMSPARVEVLLADLARAEVVARDEASGAWRFRQAMLREAAYAMLTAEDRELGHRLAAEHLAGCADADPSVVATHFERGGSASRAAPWHHAAAVHARDRNDVDALLRHVDGAFACGATGPLQGEMLVLRAEAMRWRSDHASAAHLARAALPLLEPDGAAWFAAASEAMVALGRLGRIDEVVALARAVLEAGVRVGASVEVVAALARSHEQLVFGGRYELAKELCAALVPLAEPLAAVDPVAATWLLFARADAALVVDDRGRYVELMQSLVEAFDAIGDVRSALLQRSNLADAYLNVGHAAEAAELCRRTLAAAPGFVSPHAATAARLNLARALGRLGDEQAAGDLARAAVHEARALEGRRLHLFACYSLAEIELRRGEPARAQHTLREALGHGEIPPPMRAMLETRLAEACLTRGEIREAHALSLRAMKTLFELRAVEEGEFYIRRVHAEVLAASGHVEAARETIRDARERLLRSSERLAPRWLEGYLHGVPDHARTLALAAAWRV